MSILDPTSEDYRRIKVAQLRERIYAIAVVQASPGHDDYSDLYELADAAADAYFECDKHRWEVTNGHLSEGEKE